MKEPLHRRQSCQAWWPTGGVCVIRPVLGPVTDMKGSSTMKNIAINAVTAIVLSLATLGSAGAAVAAPSVPPNASDTISALQHSGYTVIVTKTGAAPLSACRVGAIRPGPTRSRTDSGPPAARHDLLTPPHSHPRYLHP